jgi:hypothetical protein
MSNVSRQQMRLLRRILVLSAAIAPLVLGGCSTEPQELLPASATSSPCQQGDERLSALVLWSTPWDELGESNTARNAAKAGIEAAFRSTSCFALSNIMPSQPEFNFPLSQLSEKEARHFAQSVMSPCDRALKIIITERTAQLRFGELADYVFNRPRIEVEVAMLRLSHKNQPAEEQWATGGRYLLHSTDNLSRSVQTVVTLATKSRAEAR